MDGARGPVEIAHELGVTSAAVSGIVDRLEDRGHVTRRPHDTDRRRTQVVITDSGREEVIGYLMPMFAALARLDASLAEEDRELVARYLRGAIDGDAGACSEPTRGRTRAVRPIMWTVISHSRTVLCSVRVSRPEYVPVFSTPLTKRRAVDHCLVRSALCRMS